MPVPPKKEVPPPIDADSVAGIAAFGCTRKEAAAWFGVPPEEFRERLAEPALKEAWARGKARGRVLLRQTQFRLAENSPPMAQHLGRTILGQDAPPRAPARGKPARVVIDTGIDRGE
ncbi:MAG: hypothetical protein OYH76_06720 [Defluviicoccus sp.]|nr:hypothetical protein [Defluviicoccus sp.]MDE0275571.1 hypothetical protein [Defluviicoccus sp.]